MDARGTDLDIALTSLEHALAEARPVPLSASVMVNKEDLERIAQAIRAALPEEIRQARWVLKERDQLLAQAARDAEQVVADGVLERDRLLSETEIVREAHREAQRIVDRAAEEGRKIRHEAEDFVDAKLGDFEAVLQKTLSTVVRGRDRLRGRQPSSEIRDLGEDVTLPSGLPAGAVAAGQVDGAAPAQVDERSKASRFFDASEHL
jgi:hypothetical protein